MSACLGREPVSALTRFTRFLMKYYCVSLEREIVVAHTCVSLRFPSVVAKAAGCWLRDCLSTKLALAFALAFVLLHQAASTKTHEGSSCERCFRSQWVTHDEKQAASTPQPSQLQTVSSVRGSASRPTTKTHSVDVVYCRCVQQRPPRNAHQLLFSCKP